MKRLRNQISSEGDTEILEIESDEETSFNLTRAKLEREKKLYAVDFSQNEFNLYSEVGYEIEMSPNPWRKYTFNSNVGIRKIKDYMKGMVFPKLRGFSKRKVSNIELILGEAIANAVEHGNKKGEDKKVEVSYKVVNDAVFFSISDEGEGFDSSKYRYNPKDLNQVRNPRGKGLYLIAKLSDNCGYDFERKTLHMEVKAA